MRRTITTLMFLAGGGFAFTAGAADHSRATSNWQYYAAGENSYRISDDDEDAPAPSTSTKTAQPAAAVKPVKEQPAERNALYIPELSGTVGTGIAPTNYLNQPVIVLEQILTGTYADGLGNVRKEPNRIDFDPYPWHSMAIWILTQMKRWGHLKVDVNYKTVAEQVYRAADCDRIAKELGYATHNSTSARHVIMGKEFDPNNADAYAKSFKIHSMA